ncbi:hypothetical protein DRO64_11500 [Candidatus Bathyarchaeota archaeon]|nr:MAG: hypothetical protein DRO64_11500 [Candidatus Bathyarchaeota archaeon]
MRILDGVYIVGGAGYNLSGGCNVYLIDAGGELLLIDIGSEDDVELVEENIRSEDLNPKDVSVLFITHPHMDHAGGAVRAKKLFECKLAAHKITAEIIESRFQKSQNRPPAAHVEIKLRGSESLTFGDLEIQVLDTPGHTREGGDLCYLIEANGKSILFTGDVAFKCERGLMGGHPVTAWIGKRSPKEIEIYLNSLRSLLETVKPDILLPGHGLLALREGWRELDECIRIVAKHLEESRLT